MCLSALSVLGPPGPGPGGWGSNLHQNLPWTGGNLHAKFHQDRCAGVWISISPPQTSVRPFLYT